MRAGARLAQAALCLVLACATSGCGGGEDHHARPAGSEPIPSSQPPPPVPASSSSAPMFAGAATPPDFRSGGGRPGGRIGEFLAEEERRLRVERESRPQRLADPTADGHAIARETLAALPPPEEGEDASCVDAWNLRALRGRAGDRAQFMVTCRALPEDQRRCMSPSYQGSHAQECAEIGEREGRRALRAAGIDPSHPTRPIAP
ncbi:MAG: hypothetical protein M3Y87_05775 [Myxococcota bacterium]|nr:hypothetical protein [Myxococcota bacterium]